MKMNRYLLHICLILGNGLLMDIMVRNFRITFIFALSSLIAALLLVIGYILIDTVNQKNTYIFYK